MQNTIEGIVNKVCFHFLMGKRALLRGKKRNVGKIDDDQAKDFSNRAHFYLHAALKILQN